MRAGGSPRRHANTQALRDSGIDARGTLTFRDFAELNRHIPSLASGTPRPSLPSPHEHTAHSLTFASNAAYSSADVSHLLHANRAQKGSVGRGILGGPVQVCPDPLLCFFLQSHPHCQRLYIFYPATRERLKLGASAAYSIFDVLAANQDGA